MDSHKKRELEKKIIEKELEILNMRNELLEIEKMERWGYLFDDPKFAHLHKLIKYLDIDDNLVDENEYKIQIKFNNGSDLNIYPQRDCLIEINISDYQCYVSASGDYVLVIPIYNLLNELQIGKITDAITLCEFLQVLLKKYVHSQYLILINIDITMEECKNCCHILWPRY